MVASASSARAHRRCAGRGRPAASSQRAGLSPTAPATTRVGDGRASPSTAAERSAAASHARRRSGRQSSEKKKRAASSTGGPVTTRFGDGRASSSTSAGRFETAGPARGAEAGAQDGAARAGSQGHARFDGHATQPRSRHAAAIYFHVACACAQPALSSWEAGTSACGLLLSSRAVVAIMLQIPRKQL